MHPADVAALGGGRALAELARDRWEGRAVLQLGLEIVRVLQDLVVLVGVVHGQKDFGDEIVRLVGAFGNARQFVIHIGRRDVDAIAIFVLDRLLPGELHGDLRTQCRDIDLVARRGSL